MRHQLTPMLVQGISGASIKSDFRGTVDGVSVRAATHEDYEGVLDINRNMFDGFDYIPAMYHSYINHPKRLCYVAVKEGEVIGFAMFFVVDEGQAVVSQSWRVKDSFQGLGVFSLLKTTGLRNAMKNYPVTRMYWMNGNREKIQQLMEQNPRIKCTEKGKINMLLLPAHIKHILQSESFAVLYKELAVECIRVLTPSETQDMLKELINAQDLLPGGRWCVKYEVFSPMPSNYPIITHEFKSYVCTTTKEQKILRDISFGSYFSAPIGYRYRVDFYIDKAMDSQTKSMMLASHVLKHLVLIGQFNKSKLVSFSPLFPNDIKADIIKEMLFKRLALSEESVQYVESSVFLVEAAINAKSSKL